MDILIEHIDRALVQTFLFFAYKNQYYNRNYIMPIKPLLLELIITK